MKLVLKNEKDLLKYINSLNVDEGLRIVQGDLEFIITRYDLKFYLEIRSSNRVSKFIYDNGDEVLTKLKDFLNFPLTLEFY